MIPYRSKKVIAKIGYEQYVFIQAYDNNDLDTGENSKYVFKIDGSGNILNQKQFQYSNGNSFKTLSVTSSLDEILICGIQWFITPDNYKLSKYFIQKLDFNLNFKEYLVVDDKPDLINDLMLEKVWSGGEDTFINGYKNYPDTILAKIQKNNTSNLITLYKFPYYQNCFFNNEGIYLTKDVGSSEIGSDYCLVTKLDHNFNVLWTKRLNLANVSISNITQLEVQVTDYESVVGVLDLDIQSCITLPDVDPQISQTQVSVSNYDFSLEQSSIQWENLVYEISTVTSSLEVICNFDKETFCIDKASFINRYSKQDLFNYLYANEFVENNLSFVYAVGKTNGQALVSKIDSMGELVWEKVYNAQFENNNLVEFKKIIQLTITLSGEVMKSSSKSTDRQILSYLAYGKIGSFHQLVCFNSEGNEIWSKTLDFFDKNSKLFICASHDKTSFYVVVSDKNQFDTAGQPYVCQFDFYGELIQSKNIDIIGKQFVVSDVTVHAQGIVLAGRSADSLEGDSQGLLVELNQNLELQKTLESANVNTEFHNALAIGSGKYLVSGYDIDSSSVFVGTIQEGNSNLYEVVGSKNHGSQIRLNNEGFYLLLNTESNHTIHKMDWNFNFYWSKQFVINGEQTGIRNFRFNVLSERFITSPFTASGGSTIAYLNKNIESCATIVLQSPSINQKDILLHKNRVTFQNKQPSLTYNSTQIKDVISQKAIICPTKVDVQCVEVCSFVNKYPKQDLFNYLYTKEFFEGDTSYIFSVGKTQGKGLVSKIGTNGKIVWEKTYTITNNPLPLKINKIVALKDKKLDNYYVLHAISENGIHYLIGINSSGTLLWSKQIAYSDVDYLLHIESIPTSDVAHLVISDVNQIDTTTFPTYFQVDNNGNFIKGLKLFTTTEKAFLVNNISVSNDDILISGRSFDKLYGDSNGALVVIDKLLTVKKTFKIKSPHVSIHDAVRLNSGEFVVSGYDTSRNALFVSKFSGTGQQIRIDLTESKNLGSGLELNNEGVYLITYNEYKGEVHKLDEYLNFYWRKTFVLGQDNGLRNLTFNKETEHVSLNLFNQKDGSVILYLNKDLDGCLTEKLRKSYFNSFAYSIEPLEVNTKVQTLVFQNVTSATSEITSNRIELCECKCSEGTDEVLETTNTTKIQSPHIYLQATGSTGFDSTRGYHLRWALKGAIEKHIPKGDYGITNGLYNKPNDYVKIYKVPYVKIQTILDFNQRPNLVFDDKKLWIYNINGKNFNVWFKNAIKYNAVRAAVNPSEMPSSFIQNYGSELIEIVCHEELAFAVTPRFNTTVPTGNVKLELQSVDENRPSAERYVSFRKIVSSAECNNQFIAENIKTIRFQSTLGYINSISFEFYSSFISDIVNTKKVQLLGKYALTKDTQKAFKQLEPEINTVHGKWLRYNDGAYVNIENYKEKWNGTTIVSSDETIVETIEKYLELSNDTLNPLANETLKFNEGIDLEDFESEEDYVPNENATYEISNFNLLQIAALDYHVARMLGLGTIDLKSDSFSQKYIYIAEYYTNCDLGDGRGETNTQHLFCSLPTSLEDSRLPLPINLKEPVFGITYEQDTEAPKLLTDSEGYSQDGRTRFISLFNEAIPQEAPESSFFDSTREFDSSKFTEPVYAGIEHTIKNDGIPNVWDKPELPYDARFKNLDSSVTQDKNFETISIIIPEPQNPLFVHRQKEEGKHHYSSYGINWFSRSTMSQIIKPVDTKFKIVNSLLPPNNINALLIREEKPLMFSSALEQSMLGSISTDDKTLVRLLFDYNHTQELISYHKTIDGELIDGFVDVDDNEEIFANEIEVFFRHFVPNSISGNVFEVLDDPSNELLAIVKTSPYTLISSGSNNNQIIPAFPNDSQNYVGSVMLIKNKEYIIQEAYLGGNNYPEFKVFKRSEDDLVSPQVNEIFLVVENMQNLSTWNTSNPMSFKIPVNINNDVHREEVKIISTDSSSFETHLQKFRGIYRNAKIEKFIEQVEVYENEEDTTPVIEYHHLGIYKIIFENYNLEPISTITNGNRAEWYNGVVRLHTEVGTEFERKEFKVIRTENLGISGQDLVLYISDPNFDVENPLAVRPDSIKIEEQSINYYPGYKVYLYVDQAIGLIKQNVLPANGEDEHYSVFGLRSHSSDLDLASKISVPCLMFAQNLREPEQPEKPLGGLYATRPDFYGKSTYSFVVGFNSRPYSVQFNRTSDIQILSALYTDETIVAIQKDIFKEGNDQFYSNRWENLLGFNYDYGNPSLNGLFKLYDIDGTNVRLPFPNNPNFFDAIEKFVIEHNRYYNNLPSPVVFPSVINNLYQTIIPEVLGRNSELKVIDFMRDVIHNCFVPLTEIPAIFKYIKKEEDGYYPLPKKQVIRDRNGNLLNPEDPDFDVAPMMTIKKPQQENAANEILFTDFGLDGASNAKYFYAAREFNLQMQKGEYSKIIGPINLVNAAPPSAPEIVKVIPILENRVLEIKPKIQFEINSYIESQKVSKVAIYRAFNGADSLSIRTMEEVKTIDLTDALVDQKWIFTDEFENLSFVPFGDPLFYRIVAFRKIEYMDINRQIVIDYAPSEASKVIITNIMENYAPEAPVLKFYSEPMLQNGDLNCVVLVCDKTAYKGKYHLYKMNSLGNWFKISTVETNNDQIYFPLKDTDLDTFTLKTKDQDDQPIYHHFKVIVENTAGMLSTKENILTVYDADKWMPIGGIDAMIVDGTFIVRPN